VKSGILESISLAREWKVEMLLREMMPVGDGARCILSGVEVKDVIHWYGEPVCFHESEKATAGGGTLQL
jgi:hypothetical protein